MLKMLKIAGQTNFSKLMEFYFNKIAGLQPATLLKRRLQQCSECFACFAMTSSQSSKFFRVAIVSTVISEFQENLRMTGSAGS